MAKDLRPPPDLTAAGASCQVCAREQALSESTAVNVWEVPSIRLAALSAVLLVAGFAAQRQGLAAAAWAFAAALAAAGWTFIPHSLKELAARRLSIGTLMTVAAIGAVLLGEIAEAATLAFLFSVAEALEAQALNRTTRSLRSLLNLAPEVARVRRNGREELIPPAELATGDVMVVKAGERLATDGVIRKGTSAVDLSAVTGESVPVELGPGDAVFAAAINGGGVLEVEVTAAFDDNSLARLVRTVEEAQEHKARGQRLADRIAAPLVPAVFAAAVIVGAAGSLLGSPQVWIYRALVMLVAAAPCAFVISVPVTVVSAIGAATKAGVLIKGGAALEALARVRVVALDKTGTLTQNRPRVTEVVAAPGSSKEEVLTVASALEARSDHPLAGAILTAGMPGTVAEEVQAVAGMGLAGVHHGVQARLGKPGFIPAESFSAEVERLENQGASVILVERGGKVLGLVAVRDDLREEARETLAQLRSLGIRKIALLTGDNHATARALGESAGVDETYAGLMPEEKSSIVKHLKQQGPVAMVGDGVNDAPALASADVGIAMGALGADVAIEASDAALMGEDLRHLPQALAHSRKAMRIMQQNLAMSAAILISVIPLAAFGVLGLAAVVALHEVAEIFVVANGLRAGRGNLLGRVSSRHSHLHESLGAAESDRGRPVLRKTG